MNDRDIYHISRTLEAISLAGGRKSTLQPGALFASGFLAGAYIAFGFLLSVIAASSFHPLGGTPAYSTFRILLGVFFPMGLMAVLFGGAELWTGNVLFMSVSAMKENRGLLPLLYNWVGSYTGNFAGAFFLAWGVTAASGLISGQPLLSAVVSNISAAKAGAGFTRLIVLGLFCNWLVNLSVWLFVKARGGFAKAFLAWMPIFAFVAIGFEHSIANMWIIPSGIFSDSGAIGWRMFFANIIPVTIGNGIGGMLFVALPYVFLESGVFPWKGMFRSLYSIFVFAAIALGLPATVSTVADSSSWIVPVVFIINGLGASIILHGLMKSKKGGDDEQVG